MRLKVNKNLIVEILIILLVTNYMFVTIIMRDIFCLKYLRDVILLSLSGYCICHKPKLKNTSNLEYVLLMTVFFFLVLAGIKTSNISLNMITMRKYFFPLIIFIVLANYKIIKDYQKFLGFLLHFFSAFSIWGIFQAYVLKDTFLKNIGYPTVFLRAYGREMLSNSFYFGNLGIQRLVSTLSNSNAAAVVLGTTFILLICCYPYIKKIKFVNVCLLAIFVGYMATVSRANFLSMIIVFFISFYRYIPYKKRIFIGIQVCIVVLFLLGVVQGESGIVFKIAKWIQNTIMGLETSSAGRPRIWMIAFKAVIDNPMGLGFGHVGTLASNAGSTLFYYACENSYLAISLDMGIGGTLCLLSFWIILKEKIKHVKRITRKECIERRILIGCNYIVTYFMLVIMFSNHIYDLEVMSLFYVYIGLAYQICSGKETIR